MRRSTQQIIDQADELADYFESGFSSDTPDELATLRGAAHRRAVAEADVAKAVVAAVEAGRSWRAIGEAVGTTGEAARQRYGKLVGDAPAGGRRPKKFEVRFDTQAKAARTRMRVKKLADDRAHRQHAR